VLAQPDCVRVCRLLGRSLAVQARLGTTLSDCRFRPNSPRAASRLDTAEKRLGGTGDRSPRGSRSRPQAVVPLNLAGPHRRRAVLGSDDDRGARRLACPRRMWPLGESDKVVLSAAAKRPRSHQSRSFAGRRSVLTRRVEAKLRTTASEVYLVVRRPPTCPARLTRPARPHCVPERRDENPARRRASGSATSSGPHAMRHFSKETARANKRCRWHSHCDSIGRSSGSAARSLSYADGGRHAVGTGGGLRFVRALSREGQGPKVRGSEGPRVASRTLPAA
jgi:hypothetical protein